MELIFVIFIRQEKIHSFGKLMKNLPSVKLHINGVKLDRIQ